MFTELLVWAMVALPLAGAVAALAPVSIGQRFGIVCGSVASSAVAGGLVIGQVFTGGPVSAAGSWLHVDGLSAYNLAVMYLIFLLSTGFSLVYFGEEMSAGKLTAPKARVFCALWCGALASMTLVLVSNNLGIMWVGIEATTLLTAFLICVHESRESLEAMWKYILICSVGVAFAFMGTLFAAASANGTGIGTADVLLWTALRDNAGVLNPALIKIAFVFLVVGYGTKAGLAPLHTWLPDAHSQAPSPVSALFSGFMLNAALYCIMRYVPIVEAATGNKGWACGILTGIGLFSIVIAAAFIISQHDLKRLLAYHSVEHIGIITLGIGTGGLGTFAALFHTLNHSLCKSLSFFAAGRLGQIFGSHDIKRLSGSLAVSKIWGVGVFGSLLALIGLAPFSLFMSEFYLLKAIIDKGAWLSLSVFLAGVGIVFVGALAHAIPIAWGPPDPGVRPRKARIGEIALVLVPIVALVVLGVWMPEPLRSMLDTAAGIIANLAPARTPGGAI